MKQLEVTKLGTTHSCQHFTCQRAYLRAVVSSATPVSFGGKALGMFKLLGGGGGL